MWKNAPLMLELTDAEIRAFRSTSTRLQRKPTSIQLSAFVLLGLAYFVKVVN